MAKQSATARVFTSPDGVRWSVEARSPTASNIMIFFHHPDARSSSLNRYAWLLWHGPEARTVTARIDPAAAMQSLGDDEVARLFRRSMPISTALNVVKSPA
jgi:hypothetical protein